MAHKNDMSFFKFTGSFMGGWAMGTLVGAIIGKILVVYFLYKFAVWQFTNMFGL
jgi:hypothetical protein